MAYRPDRSQAPENRRGIVISIKNVQYSHTGWDISHAFAVLESSRRFSEYRGMECCREGVPCSHPSDVSLRRHIESRGRANNGIFMTSQVQRGRPPGQWTKSIKDWTRHPKLGFNLRLNSSPDLFREGSSPDELCQTQEERILGFRGTSQFVIVTPDMGAGHQITCKQISVAEIPLALRSNVATLEHQDSGENLPPCFFFDAASGSIEMISFACVRI